MATTITPKVNLTSLMTEAAKTCNCPAIGIGFQLANSSLGRMATHVYELLQMGRYSPTTS